MNEAICTPGTKLVVTAVGDRCPLKVGEVVTTTGAYSFDFLGNGEIVSFEVKRGSREGSPSRVTISRGSGFGAQFEVKEFMPGRRVSRRSF